MAQALNSVIMYMCAYVWRYEKNYHQIREGEREEKEKGKEKEKRKRRIKHK
jgi:hypothetical protein